MLLLALQVGLLGSLPSCSFSSLSRLYLTCASVLSLPLRPGCCTLDLEFKMCGNGYVQWYVGSLQEQGNFRVCACPKLTTDANGNAVLPVDGKLKVGLVFCSLVLCSSVLLYSLCSPATLLPPTPPYSTQTHHTEPKPKVPDCREEEALLLQGHRGPSLRRLLRVRLRLLHPRRKVLQLQQLLQLQGHRVGM